MQNKKTIYTIKKEWQRNKYDKTHECLFYIYKDGKRITFDHRIRQRTFSFGDPLSLTPSAIKRWLIGDYIPMVFKTQEDAQKTLDGIITELPKDEVVVKEVKNEIK